MKRWLTLLLCAATLAILLPRASVAASNTMGIDLQWDNCFTGAGASTSKNSACAVNTGVNVMFCSFVPPGGVGPVIAATGVIDVHSDQAALPSWWDITPFVGGTNCRAQTTLTSSFDFTTGPFDCIDLWAGQASGGVSANYSQVTPDPARVRINWVCAVVAGVTTDSTQHYYAARVVVNNSKTVGAGNCPGCNFGACIRLQEVNLALEGGGNLVITGTSPSLPGAVQEIYWNANPASPSCTFTPTRAQTWGQIKSLYR